MRTTRSNVNYVECVEIVILIVPRDTNRVRLPTLIKRFGGAIEFRRVTLYFDRKSLMIQPLSVFKPMAALQLDSFEVCKLVCFSRLGCLFDPSRQMSHSFPRRQ